MCVFACMFRGELKIRFSMLDSPVKLTGDQEEVKPSKSPAVADSWNRLKQMPRLHADLR